MEVTYDAFGNLDPATIYLAKPGQRLINGIQGIEEDTCHITKNFNNTSLLEFTMDLDLNGETNPIYELVQQHYEIYVTNNGWFKINEEPIIESDGNVERKTVRAESLEIELQQYDIVDFEVNTASESSKEFLATDNKYLYEDYYMFHDRVVFYRDTSRLQELSSIFYGSTIADLEGYLYDYPEILNSWRVDFDYTKLDIDIQSAVAAYRQAGNTYKANRLATAIGTIHAGDDGRRAAVMHLIETKNNGWACTELLKYIHLDVEQLTDPDDPSSAYYSPKEIIDLEIQREDELSLLTLLLKEHGWGVGYVDTTLRLAADGYQYTLGEETGQFQIDTQDIYSFITQDLANYYRCIFVFDTENYLVNAYRIESLNLDTNIYLSFHNIQNSISRGSDKQIYTVFNVLGGDDLHIDEANFGESWIEDISYFLTTDHFPQEFIDKYTAWQTHRENRRQEYIQKSIQTRAALEVALEINDRVPVDGTDTYQYATMSDDELVEEYNKFLAILEGYRSHYVDSNGDYIGDEAFAEQYPRDYSDYQMIAEQIMPNIQIAIDNRQVSSVSDTREYLDDWQFDFDTYGLSYGVQELASRIKTLQNQIDTLTKRGFNVPGEQGDEYAANQYAMYQKYTQALQEAQVAYQKRTSEYSDAYDIYQGYYNELQDIKDDCQMTNSQFGFTEEELWLLDKYRIHTDYTNENIITTSLSTAADWVNTAYELYLDAKEQLSGEAQPQWTFNTTQDNFLLMPEFKHWHGQLEVGSFIRVAMREDYQVKLRIISIGYNPFLLEPTIDLEFSNMVQYASKRDDFVSLLENGRGSNKNQISSTITSANPYADINIDSGFLLKLINNGVFSSYMTNFASDITGQVVGDVTTTTMNAVSANIGTIVADHMSSTYINVDHIVGDTAEFNELFARYIDSEYIVTQMLRAQDADIENLSARIIRVGEEGSGAITEITGEYITTNGVNARYITGEQGDFEQLTAGIINSDTIHSLSITTNNLEAHKAQIAELLSEYITANDISTDTLKARLATIEIVEADSVIGNSAFFRTLRSLSSSTVTQVVNDEYVVNLIAGKIRADQIAAGDIVLTENMRILSENGALVMNGNALQIIGEDAGGNPYVGIQLGYDTESQPSLILRNESGNVVLTPQGITQDAIADGLIINNMILPGTISKDRLGFNVVQEGDAIQLTQIYNGDEAWGVEYTNFIDATGRKLDEISQGLQDQATYTIYIETPNGVNVYGGSINLIAHLYRNNVEVTSSYPAEYFIWKRHSSDSTADEAWNNSHSTGQKQIMINGSDVNITTTFECCFEYTYEITQDLIDGNVTVVDGDQVSFEILAPGTTNYRWQWSTNGVTWTTITNNTPTYRFLATSLMNGRRYRCQVSDGVTTLTSKTTTLIVTSE